MFYRGRTEIIMCESTAYQYRRDSTYTVPYVPTIAFCANARPRTLGTLPDDASRLMRGVTTHRLVGLRPPPCVVPPRKPVGFRQRTETRKPPSWHTKAHEISRSDKLQSKICGKYFAMTTLRRFTILPPIDEENSKTPQTRGLGEPHGVSPPWSLTSGV